MRLGFALLLAVNLFGAAPIADEKLRLQALGALFPGASISRSGIQTRRSPGDAMNGERLYRVVEPPQGTDEKCSAVDVATERISNAREVAMKLFAWPAASHSRLVAAVQYRFLDVSPALGCSSIGFVARIENDFYVAERTVFNTSHHGSFRRIDLVDVTGDARDELLVEPDEGGPGAALVELHIFELYKRLDEVFSIDVDVRSYAEEASEFKRTLDIERTRKQKGRQFCFVETTALDKDRRFIPPRITRPCFPRKTSAI